jgi:hypothetical protein
MKNALIIEEQFNRRKQKTQEQKLVLENISPIWALRLKKENLPTFMSLTWMKWRSELQDASICVVGEAYSYSPQYTYDCEECNKIGCKFLYYFTLNWRGKLESNKQDFVRHWNEEHNNKSDIF